MMIEHNTPPRAAPDRLFNRVWCIVFGISLLMSGGSHLALKSAIKDQSVATEKVATNLAAGALSRDMLESLQPSDPASQDYSRIRPLMKRDLSRLLNADILWDHPAPEAKKNLDFAVSQAKSIILRNTYEEDDLASLRTILATQFIPHFEERAVEQSRIAVSSSEYLRKLELGRIVSELALAGTLLAAVVLPARRRIQEWIDRKNELDRENHFRLLHDPLTGLPNGTYLQAHLSRLAASAERNRTQSAVLRIDLEKFTLLKETLGHRTAEEVIRIAARRLQHNLRAGDFAAYLGHDNFVIVASDLEDGNEAAAIATRLQAALTKPFSIVGGPQKIGCSIGVTLLSDDSADTEQVMINAGIALAEAQSAGPGSIRYFRESMLHEAERREKLFVELLNGLEKGELVPFYQPQIDLRTGELNGLEALVRWHHPTRGLLAPSEFLDFADQTELTERVGEVVLSQALASIRAWDKAGLHVPRVCVNFALAQLRDPRLIEKIKWEVERFDIEPSRLSIEVLETVLVKSDADIVVRNLGGLASAGFHIELDDFGSGNASIANLRRFMVDRVKIDRGFIFGIESSEELRKLTAAMIGMAGALGIATLAEGVETEEAAETLRRLGCDQFQGYLVARPMPESETCAWLRDFAGGTAKRTAR